MKRTTSTKLIGAALSALMVCACAPIPVDAGEPVVDIARWRHGNLEQAQEMIRAAYDRLSDAQAANDAHLGGHAARAKELLREINEELKLAAVAANRR